MKRNLPTLLAQIHVNFGIYDSKKFNTPNEKNIIHLISTIPELKYLHKFYVDYQREYISELQRRPDQSSTPNETNVSRTVDLPFIGDAVIKTGKAKYLFVFIGSKAPPDYLTVTLHSCFWPLEPHTVSLNILSFMGDGGKDRYDYSYKCLCINPSIAGHSYVTDAVRIGTQDRKPDYLQNRQLLKREIELLNPELVVLVGREAAETIGNEAEGNSLYFKAPFPSKRWRKPQYDKKYEELCRRLSPSK